MLRRAFVIVLFSLFTLFFSNACGSSEIELQEAVATALVATQEALPTPTIEPTPTFKPTPTTDLLSETFQGYIEEFMRAASELNAASLQGVNYLSYKNYVAEVAGAFDLVLASWPEDFAPDAQAELTDALKGWDLAGYLWSLNLQDGVHPSYDFEGIMAGTEMSRYSEFDEYAGEYLEGIEITTPKRKIYYANDENVNILLSIASEHFEAGRDLLLQLLQ